MVKVDGMYKNDYVKVLSIICRYYGTNENQFYELLKNKEKKFLLLLILKNNNILDNYELINMLGIGSFKKMKSNIKTAEEKFLINSYFRKEYVELEENIKKDDEIKRKDGYSCIKEETFNKLLLLLFEYNKLEKMIKVVTE